MHGFDDVHAETAFVSSPASVKLWPRYVEPCALWMVRQ
jgi:hypothetical protein